jgi:tetratricopeptide (TPR) repeat protein
VPRCCSRRTSLTVCLLLLASLPARAAEGPGATAFADLTQAWTAGDRDRALKLAETVLKLEPDNATYLNAIGSLYCDQAQKASVFTKLSWAGKCRSAWEHAVVVDPRNLDVRSNLLQFYAQAPGMAGGGIDKAKGQAKAIAAIDQVRGELAWGQIARSEKQPAEAERHYRQAASLDSTGQRGAAALASFYASEKRWLEARAVFEQRVASDPNDRFAAFQFGRVLQAQGVELEKALALFDRYLSASPPEGGPSHADAWFRKGQVLDKLGRKADAVAAMEKTLGLNPAHAGAARELKRLKQARD